MPKAKLYQYNGGEYTLKSLAKAVGIAKSTLYCRIYEYGMNVEEAIAQGPGKNGRRFPFRGEYLTVTQISEITGVKPQTIRERLHKGWTLAQAAETLTLGVQSLVARNAAKALAGKPVEDPTAGMSKAEAARYRAAKKIAAEIAGENADAFGFRCSVPMTEYLFESDILGYRVRFTPDGTAAWLTAYYKPEGADSDLARLYKVHGSRIEEVHPE